MADCCTLPLYKKSSSVFVYCFTPHLTASAVMSEMILARSEPKPRTIFLRRKYVTSVSWL